MANYLLYLSYDGTNYSGFQIQKNAETIQGKLEKALKILYKDNIQVVGSGRTDAGVHARQQVVNFQGKSLIPVKRLPHAVNGILPPDIRVWHAREVPDHFNARYQAKEKLYRYTIDTGIYPDVFTRLYAWHCPQKLDLEKMCQGGSYLVGRHDFTSFKASGSKEGESTRTIFSLECYRRDNLLFIDVAGDGFLYKMMRIIVGTLVVLGKDANSRPLSVKEILQAKNRKMAAETAPPHGLCLWSIKYQV